MNNDYDIKIPVYKSLFTIKFVIGVPVFVLLILLSTLSITLVILYSILNSKFVLLIVLPFIFLYFIIRIQYQKDSRFFEVIINNLLKKRLGV